MRIPRRPVRTLVEELPLLRRELEQLFERLATWSAVKDPPAGEWFPAVDVFESKGRLIVQVEVPGLTAEMLRVVLRAGRLVVTGERRVQQEAGAAAAFLCLERPHGRFRRAIPLEVAVDVARAEARVQAGVLTVTLPRLDDRRQPETLIPVTQEPE